MCESKITGDVAEVRDSARPFDMTRNAWLVGEGLRWLHADGEEGRLAYQRAVEVLAHCGEATKTVASILERVPAFDHSLRWSLLYLLADVGEKEAAELFERTASEPVPGSAEERALVCHTPRDGEVLVRTMAIEGLARLAASVDDGSDRLFRVLEAQPEPALRVEAVKALLELDPNTAGRIKDLLPEQLHFALDLRRAKVEEVDVEPEREETNERLARPPRFDQPATSPTIRGGSEASW